MPDFPGSITDRQERVDDARAIWDRMDGVSFDFGRETVTRVSYPDPVTDLGTPFDSMKTTTEPTTDTVPAEAKQLAPFQNYTAMIERVVTNAQAVTVTDAGDKTGMKAARACRIELKEIRIAIEKRHKDLKADILARGQALDKGKRELLAVIEPLEEKMQALEQFAEREAAAKVAELRNKWVAELTGLCSDPESMSLGSMTEEAYQELLTGMKAAHEARMAEAARIKAEADAKAKADAEERDRLRAENERIRAEAAEAQRKLTAERAEEAAVAKTARDKADAEVAAARAEADAKERQLAQARAEQDARDKAAQDAADAEKRAREASQSAPDREKLLALADAVAALEMPALATAKGLTLMVTVRNQRDKFSAWLRAVSKDV